MQYSAQHCSLGQLQTLYKVLAEEILTLVNQILTTCLTNIIEKSGKSILKLESNNSG